METDPTKLTSFQPLTPAVTPSGFSITKLFSFAKKASSARSLDENRLPDGTSGSGESVASASSVGNESITSKDPIYSWLSNLESPDGEGPVDENGEVTTRKERWRSRNVRTILRRLSAFTLDKRWHQTTGDFKHNFKQYWMPDEHCKECYECGDKFNTFRRRHHCRVCGQIFCYRCCGQEVAGKVIGFSGDIRVCNYCHKIVHAYLSDDMEKSIQALSEDIRVCDPNYGMVVDVSSNGSINSSAKTANFNAMEDPLKRIKKTASSNSLSTTTERSTTPGRSPFDAFGVTPIEANTIKQDYLRDLWKQMNEVGSGFELLDHRYKAKTYNNCLIANDLCDWLIRTNKASNIDVAISTGQALLDNGWIEHVISTNQISFKDEYILFRPTKMALQEMETTRLRSIMFSNSDDESHGSPENPSKMTSIDEHDDDDEAPKWFKQLNSVDPLESVDHVQKPIKAAFNRGFSTGRNLDLDHALTSTTHSIGMEEDLSLQINLNSSQQETSTSRDILDQSNKISFITHVPPLPLDSYVCVDGYQPSVRRKVGKISSSSTLPDDMMKGMVVFPRPPSSRQVVELHEEEGKETVEKMAKERLILASHNHITTLLRQLLKQNKLSPTWEKIINPFLTKISEKVVPDVVRGDDMDIRRYVWITNVPGGRQMDSHLVSGVVFRKNISHKRMASVYTQPKILMMSCAIEYQRVELKMSSLDPLVLQEYAFLQNFVRRVLDVQPNILLVEKNVARVAQDMLLAGGITLIHNIKPEKMENIRRCTGAEILQKMEQVTRPKLGTCQQFRVHKYSLPSGETKTLIYLDGCAADLGCSLVLRGGSSKTLAQLKKLLHYFIYVSYHLKLESKFLMDEFAMPPPVSKLSSRGSSSTLFEADEDCNGEKDESERFCNALKKVVLSSSPLCNYSIPYLLTEEGKACPTRMYISDNIYSSKYLTHSESEDVEAVEEEEEDEDEEGDRCKHKGTENDQVIMKASHPFIDPSVLINCVDNKENMQTILNDFRARGGRVDLKMYQEYEDQEYQKVYGDEFMSKKASLTKQPVEQVKEKKVVETPKVPELKGDCFDAYNHQKIPVLFSSYSSESDNFPKPCISPWAVFMVFYGTNDITLGGFLERYCFRPSYVCSDHNCDVAMVKHIRYFAHGNGAIYINMRNLDSIIPGYDRTILTWSWCRICQQVTPVVPLSLECWSLSFAKYLELRFYGHEYVRRASAEPCGHSLHHDHYQYFSYGNMVTSFKYRSISLHEIVLPSFTVTIGNQLDPDELLKEVQYIRTKIESFGVMVLDKITDLKSEDNGTSSLSRETKIKEFLSDLQKEQCNLDNCILVVKSKVEHLVNAVAPQEQVTEDDGLMADNAIPDAKGDTEVEQDIEGDTTQQNEPAENTDGPHENDDEGEKDTEEVIHEMSDEDLHILMADIRKKLFHLKKSLCEAVEKWNAKLQDFITQDRKKDKVVGRSASPNKLNINSNDDYVDGDDTEQGLDTRPKTITHMHPEPVSEVFLTDGTILRQTYLGTIPDIPPQPSKSSKSSSQEDAKNVPILVQETVDDTYQKENVACQVEKQPGSPGLLEVKQLVDDDIDPAESASKLAYTPIPSQQQVASTEIVINAMAVVPSGSSGERDSTIVETNIGQNEKEQVHDEDKEDKDDEDGDYRFQDSESGWESVESLKVEYNSDRGEFSDNASLGSEGDIESNFPESDVYSDCEMAEDESYSDTIQIGQSAVDFVSRRMVRDTISSKKRGRIGAYTSGFTEFPKINEEPVEKYEYLTPKEAKAMQVQRRLRTEWENRIRMMAFDAERNTSSSTHELREEEEEEESRQEEFKSSSLDSNLPQRRYPLQRRNSSPMIVDASLSIDGKAKRRRSNPLIKRLVESSYYDDPLDSDTLRKEDCCGESQDGDGEVSFCSMTRSSDVKGCDTDNAEEGSMDLNISRSGSCPDWRCKKVSDELTSGRQRGHRRQKSAPPACTSAILSDVEVPSNISCGAPFVFVNPKQKELSLMATQLCEEERRDDERDIPEVVMFEGSMKHKGLDPADDDAVKHINMQISSDASKCKSDTDLGDQRSNGGDTANKRGGSDKMKKMISNLLPSSATYQPIHRPFPPWEQYLAQEGNTAYIVINDKEPTSLIAFTLSSSEYEEQLRGIQDMMAGKKLKQAVTSNPASSLPGSPDPRRRTTDHLAIPTSSKSGRSSPLAHDKQWNPPLEVKPPPVVLPMSNSPTQNLLKNVIDHPLSSAGEFGDLVSGGGSGGGGGDAGTDVVDDNNGCEEAIEDGSSSVKSTIVDALNEAANDPGDDLTSPDYHIKLQFQNSTAKFYCSVYYAEQFRQLRELIFPEGEERYVQSLSRCVFWKATGGKSGSSFSKSMDGRFVMKQMSRLEVQSFVDFSPRYFSYITKSVKEKRPSALAKLLGVYRIGFKNSDTNTTMRQDVLVMENLFYNKRVSKIYDLKGSVRSRYVHTSTKEDVLMDENLLETICDNPLFIRPHGKAVLSKAIFNDTEFLSTNMVMDYSLLVGVEEKTLKLVVGIIDYIRTYTWDKKLESYVKSTGILGGQGKMPTVVSPDVYRLRFNAAMTQHYFLMVPDKWTGFGEDVT